MLGNWAWLIIRSSEELRTSLPEGTNELHTIYPELSSAAQMAALA